MTDLFLALTAFGFVSFAAVLSTVSIHVALADRADERRRHRDLEALSRAAEERLDHRSVRGHVHAAAG